MVTEHLVQGRFKQASEKMTCVCVMGGGGGGVDRWVGACARADIAIVLTTLSYPRSTLWTYRDMWTQHTCVHRQNIFYTFYGYI